MRRRASGALLASLAFAACGGSSPQARQAQEPVRERPPVWCPIGQRAFDARVLVGRGLGPARRLAGRSGCELRVSKIDGVDQALTTDRREDRLAVEVEGGRVSAIGEPG